MALFELEEFQGPKFLGFVRAVQDEVTFPGRQFLPDVTVNDLDFEYILGASYRPAMASIISFDSEAPIRGRRGLGTRVSGELPPVKHKAKLSEKEIIKFTQPRANSNDVQQVISGVYQLTADLIQGLNARLEWMRMQALSENVLTYEAVDQGEGAVTIEFDFGFRDIMQLNLVTQQDGAGSSIASDVSTVWSDIANADPIADLVYACDLAEETTGLRFERMVLSQKSITYLQKNDAIRELIRGTTGSLQIVSLADLNALFTTYNLPTLIPYDVKVTYDDGDGTMVETRPMAQNKAILLPGGGPILPGFSTVGATLFGPTAEARRSLTSSLQSQAPGVFAQVYGKDEPPSEWVKACAVSFPSIPGADRVGQMTLWS